MVVVNQVGPDADLGRAGAAHGKEVLPMPSERSSYELEGEEIAERAIVLQVLRDDHNPRWSRAELELEIFDIAPLTVADALERLSREGVVHLGGEQVWASRCALHLDNLGMVSI